MVAAPETRMFEAGPTRGRVRRAVDAGAYRRRLRRPPRYGCAARVDELWAMALEIEKKKKKKKKKE